MESNAALEVLSALASPARLEIWRALVRAGQEGLLPSELAAAMDMPAPTLSFHLKELRTAGLAEADREGRQRRYRLRADTMRDFLSFLADDCCGGRPELCALPPSRRFQA